MLQRTKTYTRQDQAAQLARRLRGDFQAIHRLYGCRTANYMDDLAHDIELGIEYDCIRSFKIYLRHSLTQIVIEAYTYDVTSGSDADASLHSGRFNYNEQLANAIFEPFITLSDPKIWGDLKRDGRLKIDWVLSADTENLASLFSANDGAYVAGDLAITRKKYG
jgi:hypothetical protein